MLFYKREPFIIGILVKFFVAFPSTNRYFKAIIITADLLNGFTAAELSILGVNEIVVSFPV